MIRRCTVPIAFLLLAIVMPAQNTATHSARVRIVFPEGVQSEKASMTYGLYATSGIKYSLVSRAASASPLEIGVGEGISRVKALVWAPGCKMKEFDAAVGTSDVELPFVCDSLKTISFSGRVSSADKVGPLTISADYTALGTFFLPDACKHGCAGSFVGLRISGIANAVVAPDGTFNVALPDFNDDPVVANDPTACIDFVLHGVSNVLLLKPESSEGCLNVAALYPAELVFVPVELNDSPRNSH